MARMVSVTVRGSHTGAAFDLAPPCGCVCVCVCVLFVRYADDCCCRAPAGLVFFVRALCLVAVLRCVFVPLCRFNTVLHPFRRNHNHKEM